MNYSYGQSIMEYSTKGSLGATLEKNPNTKMRALNEGNIIKPSDKLFFADAVSGNLTKIASVDYVDETQLFNNAMAYRHPGDSINVSFFDGHVERMPYEEISEANFSTYHKNWGPYDQ